LASTSSFDLAPVLGSHTRDLPVGMANTVVHRDDLVLLT
jgi:hypothetical protein